MAGSKEAGAIYISLQLQTAKLQAGIASAQKSLKSLSTSAAQAGKSLSLAFTLPLAMVGRSAIKGFAEFDDAMTRSMAIMGGVSKEMRDKLVKGAEDVAKTTKFSATQAAEGYYFLAAAGLSASAALKALPVVARFATNAHIGMAEASDKLVDSLNAVGLASIDPEKNMQGMIRVSNVLTRAAMDTNVSINDLASSLSGPLGGAIRQYGLDVETAAAALEALGAQGIKGKAAGTALSIVIRELGIDAKKNFKAFKENGIEVFDNNGNFKNFIDIIGDIEKRLKGVSHLEKIDVLQKLGFTKKNIGFIQSFLGLTEKMKGFESANKQANYEQKLFADNMKSFANQMAIVKNSLQIVANKIGEDLAPSLLSLGKNAVKVAEWFKQLPEGVRKAIEGFAAFLAIGGPVAFLFGNLISAVTSLGGILLRVLVPAIGFVITAFVDLSVAATSALVALTGIALYPAVIAAAFVAAGVAIYVFWDDIVAAASNALNWFTSTFPNLTNFLIAVWISVRDAAVDSWEWIKNAASATWDFITSSFQGLVSWFSGAWTQIQGFASKAWDGIKIVAAACFSAIEGYFPGFTSAFQAVWNGIAEVATNFFNGVLEKIQWLIDKVKALKGYFVDASNDIIAADNAKNVAAAQKTASENAIAYAKSQELVAKAQGVWNAIAPTATAALEKVSTSYNKAKTSVGGYLDSLIKGKPVHQKNIDDIAAEKDAADKADKANKAAAKSAKERAKAIDSISESLDKLKNKDGVGDIQDAIKTAIDKGVNQVTFDALQKKLYDAVYKSYVDSQRDALEKAGNDPASAAKINEGAAILAQEAIDKTAEEQKKANTDTANDKAEKDKAAYDDSVSYFKDIFDKATSDGAYNFRDALKEIFIDLAANLAATLQQALGGTSAGAGGSSGSGMSGILNSVMGLFGSGGPNADGTTGIGPVANGDVYGANISKTPGVQSGDYSGYLVAATSLLNAAAIDKKNKSNEGTGGTIGAGIGAFWGPVGAQIGQALGAMIGSQFKWGPQNPAAIARHAFANFIEEGFSKLGQVSFFGKDGHLKNMKGSAVNFTEGDFNSKGSENSVSKLNALGKEARGTFLGLGLALKETLGLTDAVGEHLGAMLAENLGGSVDNARLLFQQLGLSLDDMVEKLVALGRSGSQSWLEIETAIQGVTNASMPGLEALADYKGAFQELVESGGRGVAALKGVKDIAQEGIEAGAKSLEDLKAKMLASGLDPEQVNAFFDAVKNRGIETLAELSKVSDRVGGGIVADMNANSASLAAMWAEMGNQLSDIKQKIMDIPTEVVTNYKINVTTDVDSNGQKVLDGTGLGGNLPANTPGTIKHAKGGIIKGPIGFGGNHIMGEDGPEGLVPLDRMGDGSLGVRVAGGKGNSAKSGSTIVINAPYANAGTAEHIRRTVLELEPYLTSRAVDKTIKVSNRGGNMGRNFR